MKELKGDGQLIIHNTCTSSDLAKTSGVGDMEHLDKSLLDRLFNKLFGHEVSSDPVVARIQREQAIARHKRSGS